MIQQHPTYTLSANPAENYQRFFVPAIGLPMADELMRAARLRPGEHVLDVGCGTGVVTRHAAEQVGAAGTVAGLDVNPAMLAVARSVTPPALRIEWYEASAESTPLPDEAFDVVLCQMTLQFLDDRVGGLREMRRVLVPGGRLVLSVPGPAAPMFDVMADAMARHISPQAAGFVRAVFALDQASELERLLGEAGFRHGTARAGSRELFLPAPSDFLWQYVASTPLAGIVAGADDAARSALERDVVAGWQSFVEGDGMRCRQAFLVATGERAG